MLTKKINKCPRCTMRKKCVWHKNVLGFNLIELIIVVAVAAILMAAIFLNEDPLARVGKAKDAERLQEVQSIAKAIEIYGLDNGSIPSDLNSTNISQGEILVLCSAAGTAECAGHSRECLVVSDANFLKYLNTLPVDPEKTSTTNTGYYITRTASNAVKVGACNSYDADLEISVVAKATLPAETSTCGNGVVEGAEVCDDGNNIKEQCSDGVVQVGAYCRHDCLAIINLNEVCDYYQWTHDCDYNGGEYTISDVGVGDFCKDDCSETTVSCNIPQVPEP